jgi:hypothetical protein
VLRRTGLLAAPLAASLGVTPAAGGDAPPALRCPPRGQAVIAQDTTLRVYRPKVGPRWAEVPVMACLVGHRTRLTLVSALPLRPGRHNRGPGSIGQVVTAGGIVAYVVHELTGVDTSRSELIVADVARRRILRDTPVGYSVDAGFVAAESLTALDATPEGAVAWIVQRHGIRTHPVATTVYAAARTGHIVVLDEGASIEPDSLDLSGETVNWLDAGATRSAPLPPRS